jgi:uncharacterized protein (TIGR03085 family)
MSASQHARRERRELAELLLQSGPVAPTLCEGWTTTDLAAHLVVRESRPDAAVGIAARPFAGWTDRVQRSVASQPYPELVRKVRNGPPTLSVFSLPGFDGAANLLEFYVHHEDVRRGAADWRVRDLPADLSDLLWKRLSVMGRLLFRKVPVGVVLERTDGTNGTDSTVVARRGPDSVTLRGTAGELTLRAYGRTAVQVETIGTPAAIAAFESARLGV